MTLLVQNKLTKLYNYEHKISKRFTQADYSNTKAQPTFDQISDIQRYLLASELFLDLARPNNCRIPCYFAQATQGSCPLPCDVILAGGVGQETQVENNRVTSPPDPLL